MMTTWTLGKGDGDGKRWIYLKYILRVPGKTGIIDALDIGKEEREIKAFSFSS